MSGPFVSYPLLLEYQVQPKNPPKFFEGIVVEVVWDEGENFRTVRGKLDKFPQGALSGWLCDQALQRPVPTEIVKLLITCC